MTVMNRIGGALCGAIIGTLAVILIRFSFDLGLSVLPVSALFSDIFPGFFLGGVLGAIYPKFFLWVGVLLPFDW